MKNLIIEYRSQWSRSLLAITLVTLAVIFLVFPQHEKAAVTPNFPTYSGGSFTFANPQQLIRPPIPATPGVTLLDQDQEPEVKVDLFGNVYVTAIHGVPGGVDLWKSIDKGATFTYLGEPDGAQDKCNVTPPGGVPTPPCTVGAGGGDDSIDVSTGGYLYVSSLYLANTTMSASYDGGAGGVLPGQKWEVNPISAGAPLDDRQWIAAYGPQTVAMTYNATSLTRPPGGIGLFFVKSTDAGKTFGPPVEITSATAFDETNVQGNLVVDPYTGTFYNSYIPLNQNNVIRLASSSDGGTTWNITTAYTGPAGTTNRGVFPIMTIDRGGNLHLVFTRSDDTTTHNNSHVFLMSTANPSAASPTWTSPVQIDHNGTNTGTACLAWPVAGSSGVVDITWLNSSGASPNTAPFDWHVYFAQVTNAATGSPTIASNQVGTAQVHNAAICFNGLACATGTRDMAEYYTMTVDPDGNANIAYQDSINGTCGTQTNCTALTWFTKQTAGPSAYTPPAGPPPATFAANLAMPNSTDFAEPNSEVDSYNCIFGGAIDGSECRRFRSTDAGATFSSLAVVVGPGFHGGDFDIKALAKADGTRPDQLYTVDLDNGDFHVHVGKSIDRGSSFFQPGTGGSAGELSSVSSDRMWIWGDRGVPTAADQTVYLMDHELASEDIRFAALTNDTGSPGPPDTRSGGPWSPFTSGITEPELILPPNSTFPNTNPGHVFVNKGGPYNHMVYGVFGASSVTTNISAPPFGKMPNLWEAVGEPPAAVGLPPSNFKNYPVFKGVIDSPSTAPAGAVTYGSHIGLLFPWAASDSAGNVYAVWATPSARLNAVQTGTSTPSTTFDVWFASSHDGGKTFYGPWKVSSGTGTAIFPGVAAGDNGRVAISWYQTSSVGAPMVASGGTINGGPTTVPVNSTWNVMFAQSINANSREPVFTVTTASDHPIHKGGICVNGLLCVIGGDRSLADFFQTSIGPDGLANIFSADNGTSTTHVNYMRQNGGPLALVNPSSVTCLPIPPLASVVSRKVHDGAGTFDITLPLTGQRGVECRSPGQTGTPGFDYKVVFTFVNNIPVGGCGTTSTPGGTVAPGPNANQCTVNLNGIPNAQYTTVTLSSVTDVAGNSGPVSAVMGLLIGDVNGDAPSAPGIVDSGDVFLVRQQTGQTTTSGNFRKDINASGLIDSGDVFLTRQRTGTQLPTPP